MDAAFTDLFSQGHIDFVLVLIAVGVFGGYVSVSAFLILTPCMMVFAPLGSRTANALPERLLKRLYIVFLAAMTVYMAAQTYAGIETH